MVKSIGWHKNCLKNQKRYTQELKKDVQRKIDQIQKLEKNTEFYALQIETAEKKKKSKFNEDLFLKTKQTEK